VKSVDSDNPALTDNVDVLDEAGVQGLELVNGSAESLGNLGKGVAADDTLIGDAVLNPGGAVCTLATGNAGCKFVGKLVHIIGHFCYLLSFFLFSGWLYYNTAIFPCLYNGRGFKSSLELRGLSAG
jgi:hypothetical protein